MEASEIPKIVVWKMQSLKIRRLEDRRENITKGRQHTMPEFPKEHLED